MQGNQNCFSKHSTIPPPKKFFYKKKEIKTCGRSLALAKKAKFSIGSFFATIDGEAVVEEKEAICPAVLNMEKMYCCSEKRLF